MLNLSVITDGRRGIENQALGVAEAIKNLHPANIEIHVLEASTAFKSAPANMQFLMRSDPEKYGLKPPFADIAIGCGRQAIAPLLALKKKCGRDIFTVYIQDPKTDLDGFDLVVAPEHDDVSGDNVISMIGAPNRVSHLAIVASVLTFNDQLVELPMPRVAMMIGGDSKTHTLNADMHDIHMEAARNVLMSGRSLLISTSRRTPDWVIDAYREFASEHDDVWLYDGVTPNPYFAFLGASDTILVTEDSTNMLTEACSTGKVVKTLPMAGDPGKFKRLYDRLRERCNLVPFEKTFSGETYIPLQETARVSEIILERYKARH